jgi:hypothetical protein
MEWDCPEHFRAGLKPYAPKERYYFSRGPQLVNRIVDISGFIDQKVNVNLANVTQGPGGNNGAACASSSLRKANGFPCSETTTIPLTGVLSKSSLSRAIGRTALRMRSRSTILAPMNRMWTLMSRDTPCRFELAAVIHR